jgi:uncharacterized membrane protein
MKIDPLIISVVLLCALLGAVGQIFFKLSSENFSFNPVDLIQNYKFFIGAMFYASSALLFVWALKFGNLSLLYPIIATTYIWVTLFSMIFLNEQFPLFKWTGILLIIAGISLIVK